VEQFLPAVVVRQQVDDRGVQRAGDGIPVILVGDEDTIEAQGLELAPLRRDRGRFAVQVADVVLGIILQCGDQLRVCARFVGLALRGG